MTDDNPGDGGVFDKVLYTLLSKVGGEDLQDQKRRELRQKRKELIENYELTGGPPFDTPQVMEPLVELGLQEAELIDGFEPDLLVVSERQFKNLCDIPAAVGLDPDSWPGVMKKNAMPAEKQRILPPIEKRFGEYHIDVVHSRSTDRMLLVDSGELSTEVML